MRPTLATRKRWTSRPWASSRVWKGGRRTWDGTLRWGMLVRWWRLRGGHVKRSKPAALPPPRQHKHGPNAYVREEAAGGGGLVRSTGRSDELSPRPGSQGRQDADQPLPVTPVRYTRTYMARAIWSGAISFGLVNVPVKL